MSPASFHCSTARYSGPAFKPRYQNFGGNLSAGPCFCQSPGFLDALSSRRIFSKFLCPAGQKMLPRRLSAIIAKFFLDIKKINRLKRCSLRCLNPCLNPTPRLFPFVILPNIKKVIKRPLFFAITGMLEPCFPSFNQNLFCRFFHWVFIRNLLLELWAAIFNCLSSPWYTVNPRIQRALTNWAIAKTTRLCLSTAN